jgi:aspartate/methionine/tyrosine aminotransferase
MKMAEPKNIINMGLDPDDVISFGGGWCNHEAPNELTSIYQTICSDGELFHASGRYSPITGQYQCRVQLAEMEQTIYGMDNITAENICIGHSSTQLFHDVLRVCANPGDGVAVLDPTYANYSNAIKCALPGSPMHYLPALNPDSWEYMKDINDTIDELNALCQAGKIKLLVVPNPDNPTSQMPCDDFFDAAIRILSKHGCFLVTDYAYKALWFDDMPRTYSWSPREIPNLITLHSNSKWLSSLGRRFGWVEAHEDVIAGLEKIAESALLSPDTLHTMATTRLIEQTLKRGKLHSYIESTRELYRKTAEITMAYIDTYIGQPRLTPEGGLYTVMKTPDASDPVEFVERVMKNTGVLFIPGVGFGPSMEKAVRISYGPLCHDHDKIKEAMERVGKYLSR